MFNLTLLKSTFETLSFRVAHNEKVRVSQKIQNLSQESLGELVRMIEENCPQAFKETDKDLCHIFVDNIPKSIFTDISE